MGARSRRSRRAVVAVVLAVSLIASAGASLAAGPWPDGEWYGFISGGGVGSGTFTEDSGSGRFASGNAIAGGFFTLEIADGESTGEYGITWRGAGSAGGRSGTTEINELGAVEGTDGIPLLARQSASGSTTSEGFTLPFAVPRLDPAPTPLFGDFADCQMVEGTFEGKLAALADAFRDIGFKVATEEAFTAFRVIDGSAEAKEELTKRIEDLRTIANSFGLILADIDSVGIGQAVRDAEALLAEAEGILVSLGALPECDGVNLEGFSLGISKALEVFVEALLQVALNQQDGKAIANLAALAGRGGILPYVGDVGIDVTRKAAEQASADKDAVTLDYLIVAAFTFGDIELLQWIVGEIAAIGGES